MNVWDIPDLDDVLKLLAPYLGSFFGTVLLLFVAMRKIVSWVDEARKALKLGRSAKSAVAGFFAGAASRPGRFQAVGYSLTIFMLVIQAIWLVLAFVVGNILSRVLGLSEDRELSGTVLRDFVRSLRIDPVSMGYFVLCLGSLIYVYRNQRRRGGFGWLANLLAVPMFPLALFGTLGATLFLLDYLGVAPWLYRNRFTSGQIVLAYVIGAFAIGYIAAARTALLAPALVRRYWASDRSVPDDRR